MKTITVKELNKWMTSNKEFQLIDVRETFEWAICKLPNSELLPMDSIPNNLDKINKDIPVVMHCKKGGRSQRVIDYLKSHNFTNLINLEGGILAWISEIDNSMEKY